jgi:hypothetical protein
MDHHLTKPLREKWCIATVADAVKLFNTARIHPDNESVPLETIAIRCANTAFAHVAATIVGDKDATAKRYGELCYARFKREVMKVITAKSEKEEMVC